jgi:dTMP kinase
MRRDGVIQFPSECLLADAAEAFPHFAAHERHIDDTIAPALHCGEWVINDRFLDSHIAYQAHCQKNGCRETREPINLLTKTMPVHPAPTIILDVSEETATRRLTDQGASVDRYEREGVLFRRRVRQGYRNIAEMDLRRCVVVVRSQGAPRM